MNSDILSELVGYHLRRAQVAFFENYRRMTSDFQITPGQFGVLTLISANPGLTQSALARAMRVERSTMVTTIDLLESRTWVERRPSPVDRRSNALFLTNEGIQLLERLKQVVREHEATMMHGFTASEQTLLKDLLRRLWAGYS